MEHELAARRRAKEDFSERKRSEEGLRQREAILEAVAFSAQRFLSSPWEEVIDEVLERLGRATEASRVWLFQNDTDGDGRLCSAQRHEWCAPGVVSQLGKPTHEGISYEETRFGDWLEVLGRGEVVTRLTRDLPPHQAESLIGEDIRSILDAPVFVGDEFWGVIGVDDCVREREWTAMEIDSLRVAASTLGAAIERQRAERALEETESWYRNFIGQIDYTVTYIKALEEADNVLYISPQVEAMFGFPVQDWMGRIEMWDRQTHPDDIDRVNAEKRRSVTTGEPSWMDYRMVTRDGQVVWVHESTKLVRDERGEPLFWQGAMFDITARKRAEEQLAEAEARFRTLVEQLPGVTYVWNEDPERVEVGFIYVSPQAEDLLGVDPAVLTSMRDVWSAHIHPADVEAARRSWSEAMERGDCFSAEYRWLAPDHRTIWVRDEAVVVERDPSGRARRWQGVVFNITERKNAEEERHQLVARLIAAQEEERARIAEDIHDDSIQAMTAVALRVETLRRTSCESGDDPSLDRIAESVQHAIIRLRHLMFELHPRALDEDGLAAALQVALEELSAETGASFEFRDLLHDPPRREARVLLYRIAQEALANIRVHADASRVQVTLENRDGGVRVEIRDDGRGFEAGSEGRSPHGHLGLSSMRQRAEMGRGWWRVASQPGRGTTVEFWLPASR